LKNKWVREAKGFSLLEVLVSLVFLAVGLLALAGLHVTSLRGNNFSQQLTLATVAAQDRLEFLKNLPLNSNRLLANRYDDQQVTLSGISFERTYRITEEDNRKTIQYTVRWNDGRRDHSVTFATQRAQ
jgi:prepilin-type N-terminal cleavage/methylation domain-containing protein